MSVELGKITLIDKWPGPVNPSLGTPRNGWGAGADGTTPKYPLGTKIMGYSDASVNPGWYTMAYVEVASPCSGTLTAAGGPEGDVSDGGLFMGHCDLTADAADATYKFTSNDGSTAPTYVVSACFSSVTDLSKGTGRFGIMCHTASGYEYGWMWVGGVCPVGDVSIFRGALDAAAGGEITVSTNISSRALYVADTTSLGLVLAVCPTLATQTTEGSANYNCMIGFCDVS